jgi:outer membrane protein assembly factor BamA
MLPNHGMHSILRKRSLRLILGLVCAVLIQFIDPAWLHAQTKDGEVHAPGEFFDAYIKITGIEVTGNKRTHERIITRELDFKMGDSLATFEGIEKGFNAGNKRFSHSDSSEVIRKLNYSRENIINTKLFLMVDLYLEQVAGEEYKLRINVQERWYFWVFPIIQLDYPNFNEWLAKEDRSFSDFTQGLFMSHNNMWGLSHQASVLGYLGSSKGIGLGYYIPWIGKGQKIGMRVGALYRNSTVVEYGSLISEEDGIQINERQMIYQEGSLKQYDFLTTFTVRPGLYNDGKIRIMASHLQMSDSLYSLTLNDSIASYLPIGHQSTTHFDLYIEYAYDTRNNRSYPLYGTYMMGFVDKRGIGILARDVDYFYYGVDFHFYQQLSRKWYTAEMFKFINSSSENIPYHYKQNLTSGSDFIRGYDFYALRGDQMYYFRSNVKYELIAPNIKKARNEKHKDSQFRNLPYAFYLNTFADLAYVRDDFYGEYNPLNNRMLYSWGVGIDFVTYYDMVLRFEYAFTIIGTHGFFFGFGLPV